MDKIKSIKKPFKIQRSEWKNYGIIGTKAENILGEYLEKLQIKILKSKIDKWHGLWENPCWEIIDKYLTKYNMNLFEIDKFRERYPEANKQMNQEYYSHPDFFPFDFLVELNNKKWFIESKSKIVKGDRFDRIFEFSSSGQTETALGNTPLKSDKIIICLVWIDLEKAECLLEFHKISDFDFRISKKHPTYGLKIVLKKAYPIPKL